MLHEPFFTDTADRVPLKTVHLLSMMPSLYNFFLCNMNTSKTQTLNGSVFLVPILWRIDCVEYRGYTFYFSFDHVKDGVLTPCKVIWIREFRKFCFWSLQSGKVLPAESGNMAFGIHNSTQGTLKPTNNGIWNSSSTDRESRILHLEFGIQHGIQNPILYLITLHTCRVTVLLTPPSSWISFVQVSLNSFVQVKHF